MNDICAGLCVYAADPETQAIVTGVSTMSAAVPNSGRGQSTGGPSPQVPISLIRHLVLAFCGFFLSAAAQAQNTIVFSPSTNYVPSSYGRQLSFSLTPGFGLGNSLSGATLVVALPPGVSFVSTSNAIPANTATLSSLTGTSATGQTVTLAVGEPFAGGVVTSGFVFNNLLTVSIDNTVADGTMLQATFRLTGTLTSNGATADSGPVSVSFQAGYLPVSIFAAGYGATCNGQVRNADFTASNFRNSSNTGSSTSGSLKSDLSAAVGGLPAIAIGTSDQLAPTLPSASTPVKLGDISGPNSQVRLIGIGGSALAYGGFALFPNFPTGFTASNLPAFASCVSNGVSVTLSFSNPNPYSVRLKMDQRDNVFLAAGNGAATGFAFTSSVSTQLGVGNGSVTDIGNGVETSKIFRRIVDSPDAGTVELAYSISCFAEGQSICASTPPSDTTQSSPSSECVLQDVAFGGGCELIAPGVSTGASLEFDATRTDASGSSNIATDAMTGSVTLIRTGYGSGSGAVSLRIYRGDANLPAVQAGDPAKLRFTGGSPIELTVTDAQGRRVGFRPAPNPPPQFLDPQPSVFTELPGASYSGIDSHPQVIEIPDPQPGSYQVQVLGTGNGTFLLTTETLDINDKVIDDQNQSGSVTPGSSSSFTFNVDEQGHVSMPGGPGAGPPPTTVASLSPQPNGAGWENSNVTVTLTATASAGGIAVKQITYSATGAQNIASMTVNAASVQILISTEGITTLSFFATDTAGDAESSKNITIRLDETPPSINCGTPDGLWHATDVTISCSASDSGSGLANSADASFSLNTNVPTGTETSNATTGTHTVCDVAGNCVTAGPITGNMVDKKPPSISISSPTGGSNYLLNQAVNANYSCTDGGSGVATCSGTVANGSPVDTASVGSKTFSVNAADKVGNVAPPQSVSYSVAYGLCLLYDPTRSVQSGSTIPLKIQLCDANNADVSSSTIVVHAVSLVQTSTNASEILQASGNANPDNDFRFDSTLGPTGGYIFNLSTKGLTTGSYLLTFTAGADPATHTLTFQVR